MGGPGVFHDCGLSRSVGWFLEPLVVLALFGKKVRSLGAALVPAAASRRALV